MITFEVKVTCDYEHDYENPGCVEKSKSWDDRPTVVCVASWDPVDKKLDVQLPRDWFQNDDHRCRPDWNHACPDCIASWR